MMVGEAKRLHRMNRMVAKGQLEVVKTEVQDAMSDLSVDINISSRNTGTFSTS
jgi:hypothetical protein